MPTTIVITQGQSIGGLAVERGLYCMAIWNDPANAALREQREHMNVLMPGDVVTIPDKQPGSVTITTGRKWVFRRRGVPAVFRLQLTVDDQPVGEQAYRLVVDGQIHEGTTSAAGVVEVFLPPTASRGQLAIPDSGLDIALLFNHLDPASEISGVQKRLRNLGLFSGQADGVMSPETVDAICWFQRKCALAGTGQFDDVTLRKLREIHDAIDHDADGETS